MLSSYVKINRTQSYLISFILKRTGFGVQERLPELILNLAILGFHITQVQNKIVYCSVGSKVGAVVRALAFHQCVPGSIPGLGVICGLSLLVLYSAPRGFSPGTPVFPSPQKPTFDWMKEL